MIKRKFFLITLLFFIISCSSLEFVYNDSVNPNKIKQKTLLSIIGDNKNIINSYLLGKLGEVDGNPVYKLTIVSSGQVEATVIEIDATASKFMIKHDLVYTLTNIVQNCQILEKSISSKNLYDAKSAGYSFGTDLAEKEFTANNLHSNIDKFLNELAINYIDLNCK